MPLLRLHKPCRLGVLACLAASAIVSGCAHVQVDETGRTHLLGLLWLTLPAPLPQVQAAHAGQGLRVRALGLSWLQADSGSSLVLGWQDSTLAYLLDHRLVDARAVFQRLDPTLPMSMSMSMSMSMQGIPFSPIAGQCPAPTGATP